ncbi:unnamed protein product [Schistocephalus solidus]|uniref:Protein kinase domain-containing protein n=1 Tax=Schistocephalus solidus TaxID=70667 RepID=A0A183SFE1_SCHSO|nr:unnamed protein product [Schistocephalus solidus]
MTDSSGPREAIENSGSVPPEEAIGVKRNRERRPSDGSASESVIPHVNDQTVWVEAVDAVTGNHVRIMYSNAKAIGSGSFGMVFVALLNGEQEVAIKKVLQDKRYKEEPSVARHHCCNCGCLDSPKPKETYLNLVQEYIPQTLSRVIKHYGYLRQLIPIFYVKLYSFQLIRGLAYVHNRNICHRDIKPQNLLVNPETGVLKICDFGSATTAKPLLGQHELSLSAEITATLTFCIINSPSRFARTGHLCTHHARTLKPTAICEGRRQPVSSVMALFNSIPAGRTSFNPPRHDLRRNACSPGQHHSRLLSITGVVELYCAKAGLREPSSLVIFSRQSQPWLTEGALFHFSTKVLVPGEPNVSYICSRYYRAPELIFGATQYTVRIDMWSAGCVIGELLLGRPLFPGDSGVDQLVEIIKVLGTPTLEQVKEMNPQYSKFVFPSIKGCPWEKVRPASPPPPPERLPLVFGLSVMPLAGGYQCGCEGASRAAFSLEVYLSIDSPEFDFYGVPQLITHRPSEAAFDLLRSLLVYGPNVRQAAADALASAFFADLFNQPASDAAGGKSTLNFVDNFSEEARGYVLVMQLKFATNDRSVARSMNSRVNSSSI